MLCQLQDRETSLLGRDSLAHFLLHHPFLRASTSTRPRYRVNLTWASPGPDALYGRCAIWQILIDSRYASTSIPLSYEVAQVEGIVFVFVLCSTIHSILRVNLSDSRGRFMGVSWVLYLVKLLLVL